MDYDVYAEKYAQTRWALPWIANPLVSEAKHLPRQSTIVEIGCGTANYIIAISKEFEQLHYKAFDISEEMLRVARSRSNDINIEFQIGNAESRFPYRDQECDMMFTVDVIHHIAALDIFFAEALRVLKPGGRLLIVTDSEENIRRRSLTKFFPEILQIELDRYPKLEELNQSAEVAGFIIHSSEKMEGHIDFTDDFISALEKKCASAMRIISQEAHKRGLSRVKVAQKKGEAWFSCYTLLKYDKLPE